MCLNLGSLVAQYRRSFLARSLVNEVRLVFVLLSGPEGQVAPVFVGIRRETLLVHEVLLVNAVGALMDVRVDQLGERAFRYQIGVLHFSLLLSVWLRLPCIGRLLLTSIALGTVFLVRLI